MATLRKRGGNYILIWQSKADRDEHGKPRQRWQNLGRISKREAEARCKAKTAELATAAAATGLPGGNSDGRRGHASVLPLGGWAEKYLMWHAAEYPHSHARIEQIAAEHLLPALGHYPLDSIPVAEVEQYKTRRRFAGAKAATVAKEIRTLHAIINRAERLGIIARNPIRAVRAPQVLDRKAPRFYSAEELQSIYAACIVPWHAPVWKLLANTGMRRGEALALRWAWVKETTINIISTGEERTKSGLSREIPLSAGAADALAELARLAGNHFGEANKMVGYVLPQIEAPSLSRAFIKAAKRAGVGGSMHDLRHTYISHLVMQGVGLRTVQIYAGHSSYRVTEQYAHLAPGYGHAVARELKL